MSLDFYCEFGEKCLNEKLIEATIRDYFNCGDNLERGKNFNGWIYHGFTERDKLHLYYTPEEGTELDYFESEILGCNFYSKQSLLLAPNRDEGGIDLRREMLKFFIYIQSKVDSDVLVWADCYGEICLVTDEGVTWADNELISSIRLW